MLQVLYEAILILPKKFRMVESPFSKQGAAVETQQAAPQQQPDAGQATGPGAAPAAAPPAAVLQPVKSIKIAGTSLAALDSALLFGQAGSASAAQPTPQQVEDALELLHTLLKKIARLDNEGTFMKPVTEAEAPGYFNIIKQPMCLQTMHEKLDRREYRTWRSFVDDFVLICSNAMTYNQKRSRIHQKALIMLRQGKKMLAETELAARRALTLVHPEGPAKAALDEQKEQREMLARGLSLPLSAASLPLEDVNALKRAASVMPHADSFNAETGGTTLDSEDLGLGYDSSEDAAYSSFSDTDMSDQEEQPLEAGARLPPLVLPNREVTVTDMPAGAPFRQPQEGAAAATRDAGFKEGNRDIERRCRWLELRLHSLGVAATGLTAELSQADPGPSGAHGGPSGTHRSPHGAPPGLQVPSDIPFVASHLRLLDHMPRQLQRQVREADPCLPARVYAGLELVERQIAALKKHLQVTAQSTQVDGHGDRRGRGRGRGRGMHRSMSGRGRGNPGGPRSAPAAADSFNKRRRLDGGYDMVAPLRILAPKFVEKAQVAPIATPGFRVLADAELKQRAAAITALAKHQKLPAEVEAQLANESSSEEDTSDEAYELRHMQREQEERDWYAQYTAGNLQKNLKNKNSKKPRGAAGKAPKPQGATQSGAAPATSADAAQPRATQQPAVTQPAAGGPPGPPAGPGPSTRTVRLVRTSPNKDAPQQAPTATGGDSSSPNGSSPRNSGGPGRGRGQGRGSRGGGGRGSGRRGRGGRLPKPQ